MRQVQRDSAANGVCASGAGGAECPASQISTGLLEELQRGALEHSNVSFCTREHFGRLQNDESQHYIRLAYSGIKSSDIKEGLSNLKKYFESS